VERCSPSSVPKPLRPAPSIGHRAQPLLEQLDRARLYSALETTRSQRRSIYRSMRHHAQRPPDTSLWTGLFDPPPSTLVHPRAPSPPCAPRRHLQPRGQPPHGPRTGDLICPTTCRCGAAPVVSLPPPRRLKSSVHLAGNLPDPPLHRSRCRSVGFHRQAASVGGEIPSPVSPGGL
jgi:hypothetical protein